MASVTRIRDRNEVRAAARDLGAFLPVVQAELSCPACGGHWTQFHSLGDDYQKTCPCPYCKRNGAELAAVGEIDTLPYLNVTRRQ